MAESRLLIVEYSGVTTVTFPDSAILEPTVISQIAKDLYALADEKQIRKLVLDFSKVRFLASHALGILLTLRKKSRDIKGTLVLCGLRPDLMKVFKITSLDKIFTILPDDAAALASFGVTMRQQTEAKRNPRRGSLET